MNPYYATGFLSAMVFWVWPAFLYKAMDVHWLVVVIVSALLFLGVGRVASDLHVRFIAPMAPPRGPTAAIVAMCGLIVALGLLTRVVHYFVLKSA